MIDREKIVKGLECCFTDMDRSDSMPCRSCPYGTLPKKQNCQKVMFADILALLKEQEAIAPKRIDGKRNHFIKCGNCNCDLMSGYYYCPHCGKAVKWDG